MIRIGIIAVLLCASIFSARADEYRPAYLKLSQTSDNVFDVLWKVPVVGDGKRLRLFVEFSNGTKTIIPSRGSYIRRAHIERSTISSIKELVGTRIIINGLEQAPTDVLVRIQRLDGTVETMRLNAAKTSFTVKGAAQFWDVLQTYLVFGVEHILGGFDHLLFVACLIFIAGTWRRLLVTITGFTVAHSITLTLSALDLFRLPVPPIEAVIALSIVFLSREIVLQKSDTLTWRYPIAVSASFGLLHGFGFASALKDIGLPQTEIPTALLAFNVGVEIGQLLFVISLLLALWTITECLKLLKIRAGNWLNTVKISVAYTVGGVSMYWTIERTLGFWV